MSEEKKQAEMKEEDLKDVNGGGWWSSIKGYKSGDTPLFKVGEKVAVKSDMVFCFGSNSYKKGTIKSIQSKSSNVNSEYRYEVQYEDGTTETDVFESQMLYEKNGSYNKNV